MQERGKRDEISHMVKVQVIEEEEDCGALSAVSNDAGLPVPLCLLCFPVCLSS